MKGKLLEVPLNELHPNPFRDEKRFPLRERRVAQLQESIEAEGFWEGVIARKADGDYEIAFGHHRVEAARRVLGKSAEIPVIVKDLDESDMIRMMERENIADGLGFYYTTVQIVAGAVRALGEGKVKRGPAKGQWPEEAPCGASIDELRMAPSFIGGPDAAARQANAYTSNTLSRFLGDTESREDAKGTEVGRATRRIRLAVSLLEMIERGYVTPADCAQLETQAQFDTIVQAARQKLKIKEQEEDAELSVLEEAKKRYEREKVKGEIVPNKPMIEKVEKKIEKVKERQAEDVSGQIKRTVKHAVDLFKSGGSVKEVRKEVVGPINVEKAVKRLKETAKDATLPAYTFGEVESLARRYDGIAKDDERIRAIKCKNKAAKEKLAESVKRLQARLRGYSAEGL